MKMICSSKKRSSLLVSLAAAAVLVVAPTPAVAGFWDNQKEAAAAVETEENTVKLAHQNTASSGEDEPVEYGVDVVSAEVVGLLLHDALIPLFY